MKSSRDIEKLFKDLHDTTSAEMDQRVLRDVSQTLEKPNRPNIWRIIMKTRITKLAAAAVIIIAVLIGINQFGGSIDGAGVAYAISDVFESFQEAKTIHIQGKNYYPPPPVTNIEQRVAPFEYWIDIENGRARIKHPGFSHWISQGRVDIYYFEDVITDKGRININHRKKKASYFQLQQDDNYLLVTQQLDNQLKQIFGDPEHINDFVHRGTEQIDDLWFDIWEAEIQPDPDSEKMLRIKMWVSQTTTTIGQVRLWLKTSETNWALVGEIDKIEYDVSFPPNLFDISAPKGYVVNNSIEAPARPELVSTAYYGKHAGISIFAGCLLEDGSIIAAWSSTTRKNPEVPWQEGNWYANVTQIELFKKLEPAGPLPELPIVPVGLKKRSLWDNKTSYTGRHLAYTVKDNNIYEWTIYVPEKTTDQTFTSLRLSNMKSEVMGYDPILEFHPEELANKENYNIGLHVKFIANEENFDSLLREYIADFSDNRVVPGYITYDKVLELADQIRASIIK